MGFSCRINRNISLNQLSEDGSRNGCNSTDISMGIGGIRTPIYVYNVDEVENLKFENDNRADDSLTVDTIITDSAFYSIDFSSASYDEEYDDGKWSHTLSLEINNITSFFEDLLSDSVNGKYLVAFRPNGSDDYRMFGWKDGATLKYSMGISQDSQGYTVELTDDSEYPLFTVYRDNFSVRDKVYSPVFKVLYNVAYCEQSGGKNSGYAVAMYVVKVNSAGQALDRNNMLCQWSGLKQDAYKLNTVTSDGGYNIIGTYDSTAQFDGIPVRVYNLDICPADANGTITINGSKEATINLNSTTTSTTVTIKSDNTWTLLSNPKYVSLTSTDGNEGTTNVTIFHNGTGGVEILTFQNRVTKERVTLTVNINLIKIDSLYTYQYGITEFILTPIVEGSTTAYTYTVTPTLSVTKGADNYLTCRPTVSTTQQTFTFTLTHGGDANEKKTVQVVILGNNTNPTWVLISQFCEDK